MEPIDAQMSLFNPTDVRYFRKDVSLVIAT